MNPKQMQKMMQQMGIKNEEIIAKRVIIEREGESIIIESPQIVKITMQVSSSYQISGTEKFEAAGAPQEDITMVMEQTGVGKEEAESALRESNGDIADAIMKLKEKEG